MVSTTGTEVLYQNDKFRAQQSIAEITDERDTAVARVAQLTAEVERLEDVAVTAHAELAEEQVGTRRITSALQDLQAERQGELDRQRQAFEA